MGKEIYWKLADRFSKTKQEQEEEEEELRELEKIDNTPKKRISMVQCEDLDGKVVKDRMLHL